MLGALRKRWRDDRDYRSSYWIIGIMTLVLLVSVFEKRSRLSTNPRSRIITVERLVDAGTWAHITPTDTTPFEPSIDVVKVGDNIYSSKPPNYPLIMAGQSFLLKGLTGMNFYEHRVDYLRMLLILNQVLPYALMLFIAFLFMRDFTEDRWTLNFMLLALSIGLLPFGYAPSINNHTVSAVLFFISFFLVYRIIHKGQSQWWMYFLVGLLSGFAVTIELPGGVFAVWYLILLLRHDWKRTGIALAGMVLPFIPMFYVYWHISGSIKPFYLRGELYRFEGAYWHNAEGLDLLREPKHIYLFNMLLGFKGFLLMTPLFFLSLWAFGKSWLKKIGPLRLEFTGIMVGIGIIIWFILTRTRNYGGDCIGMRWFIPFMPLLMLMAFPVVEELSRKLWGRVLCAVLLLLSMPWVIEALYIEAFIRGMFQNLWM